MFRCLTIGCLVVLMVQVYAQSSEIRKDTVKLEKAPDDADSLYIGRYTRVDDIRLIFGGQGSNISYGSTHDGNAVFGEALYHNVNDLVGFGLTYKFIDFDL